MIGVCIPCHRQDILFSAVIPQLTLVDSASDTSLVWHTVLQAKHVVRCSVTANNIRQYSNRCQHSATANWIIAIAIMYGMYVLQLLSSYIVIAGVLSCCSML